MKLHRGPAELQKTLSFFVDHVLELQVHENDWLEQISRVFQMLDKKECGMLDSALLQDMLACDLPGNMMLL